MKPVADHRPSSNPVGRILAASMIGTTVEFFDFYIYATAAVLVFPRLFFKPGNPAAATLESLATFGLAFLARPLGSAVFGHFGDRVGRKATLVAALLTMGVSTVSVGLLPTYDSIGVLAPALLCLCRFGQGFGLGGEWGGAVLLATENAPPGRASWYGSFPQLGAPIGFWCSTGVFLLLTKYLAEAQFLAWGWRIPFLASIVLVGLGLYVRLQVLETPAFRAALARGERSALPIATVLARHRRVLVLGTLAAVATFVLFYLMTVFSLSWATSALHMPKSRFLVLQMMGVVFFGLAIPLSAQLADRLGARAMMIATSAAITGFGFLFSPMFDAAGAGAFLMIGLGLMGLTYGPLSSALSALFPTAVRYTGVSMTFNLAGILGASLAPNIATWLAMHHGLGSVGLYLSGASAVTLLAWLLLGRDLRYGPAAGDERVRIGAAQ